MIILAPRASSRAPEIWHVYIATWKAAWLDALGLVGISKSERTVTGRSGAQSRALANQTRVAESLNITTSKIRAGVRLARATIQTHLTQRSFLWQIMCLPPQITGNRAAAVIQFFCDCFGWNFPLN